MPGRQPQHARRDSLARVAGRGLSPVNYSGWRIAGPPRRWTVGPQVLSPPGAGLVLEQVQLCGGWGRGD